MYWTFWGFAKFRGKCPHSMPLEIWVRVPLNRCILWGNRSREDVESKFKRHILLEIQPFVIFKLKSSWLCSAFVELCFLAFCLQVIQFRLTDVCNLRRLQSFFLRRVAFVVAAVVAVSLLLVLPLLLLLLLLLLMLQSRCCRSCCCRWCCCCCSWCCCWSLKVLCFSTTAV